MTAITMRYRHYKGGLYELVCEATLESDLTPLIVYRSHDGSIWVRPRDVFFETVEGVDGKPVARFTALPDPAPSAGSAPDSIAKSGNTPPTPDADLMSPPKLP